MEFPVLVHCIDGINRAPACIASYLILYEEMSAGDALSLVTDANSNRTRALLMSKGLLFPEESIVFPTLTNGDWRDALQHLLGAFVDGAENGSTVQYIDQWQQGYLQNNSDDTQMDEY